MTRYDTEWIEGTGPHGVKTWRLKVEPTDTIKAGRRNHRVKSARSWMTRRDGYSTTQYDVVTVCDLYITRIHYWKPGTETTDLCKKGCWEEATA